MFSNSRDIDDNYKIRWNSGSAEFTLSESLRDLRENSDLFDVSIACNFLSGGVKSLRAHKVILSAYSNVFRDMFLEQVQNTQPFVFLKGVSFNEISAILDFMYNGEVNISQNKLNSFLNVAEELQVKGLQANKEGKHKTTAPKVSKIIKPETLNSYLKEEDESTGLKDETSDPEGDDSFFDLPLPNSYLAKPTENELSSGGPIIKTSQKPRPPIEINYNNNIPDDEHDEPVIPGELGHVEDFIKNLPQKMSGGIKPRTLAQCRFCKKEARRDKIKVHIKRYHSEFLVETHNAYMNLVASNPNQIVLQSNNDENINSIPMNK